VSRRDDPGRIYQAHRAGLFRLLVDTERVNELDAEHLLARWEHDAEATGRPRDSVRYWVDAWQWIEDQRGRVTTDNADLNTEREIQELERVAIDARKRADAAIELARKARIRSFVVATIDASLAAEAARSDAELADKEANAAEARFRGVPRPGDTVTIDDPEAGTQQFKIERYRSVTEDDR
jgi:hypothetical protein